MSYFCLFIDKLALSSAKAKLKHQTNKRPFDYVCRLGNAQLVAQRAYLEIS
jgi:hypothetical protein